MRSRTRHRAGKLFRIQLSKEVLNTRFWVHSPLPPRPLKAVVVSALSKVLSKEQQGLWMGNLASAGSAGRIIAPTIAGYVYSATQSHTGLIPLAACFAMISEDPFRLLGHDSRIVVGGPADLVLLPAPSRAATVSEIGRPLWGMKAGRMTFEAPAPRLFRP